MWTNDDDISKNIVSEVPEYELFNRNVKDAYVDIQ
jgi:hypothetical protein